ncbi:hypothetical protein BURCENBC7_AP5752 [Burkholderia cenocepacia BC7]|nr:uncharacterized protein BCN122_I0364 [Burkholderia cenocepacia]EPZ86387.1 hypothetical protein BURCENK562V_C6672 [Burkholderia cenocepacia K56-2Valvano]ERI26181.1 hypothetical protein BURCENBC7_AP5752 [Burkholderia cenocepacia BC7]
MEAPADSCHCPVHLHVLQLTVPVSSHPLRPNQATSAAHFNIG